jgi:succinate dehydrogenase / fumarate reductase cytochrome b subunit
MLGGLRYLIWDTGRGFGATERELMVRANLAGSIILTIVVWVVAYLTGGLR